MEWLDSKLQQNCRVTVYVTKNMIKMVQQNWNMLE